MTETLPPEDFARIKQLVEVFHKIGEERMKDIPLYNPNVGYEALGFRNWEGWLAGMLITPWFINFMMLPGDKSLLAGIEPGTKRRVTMPKAELVFTVGEVEEVGPYIAYSVHSPLGQFPNHDAAYAAAAEVAEGFFQPPPEQDPDTCGA